MRLTLLPCSRGATLRCALREVSGLGDLRQDLAGQELELLYAPVEGPQHDLLAAAEGGDLRADLLRQLLGLAQEVELLPVRQVHARVDLEVRGGNLGPLALSAPVDEA